MKKRAQTAKRKTVSFSRAGEEEVVDDSNLRARYFGKSEFSNPS